MLVPIFRRLLTKNQHINLLRKMTAPYLEETSRCLRSRGPIKTEASVTDNAKHNTLKAPKAKKGDVKPNKGLNVNAVKEEEIIVKTKIKIEPVTVKEEACCTNSETNNTKETNLKPTKKGSASTRKRKIKEENVASKEVKVEKEAKDMEDIGWEPQNWREVYDNILKMRKQHVAPVDSLGCEECPEKDSAPEVFRYQTLISIMLSSQTRDEVTYAATQRLIEHGLTVDSVLNTADEKIGELIYPAGFWKSKVKFIKNTTKILKEQYSGDIPRTFKDLCKLPGVGPKMANIVMSVAWNETVGIAVDTHVHRISNRLGWVPKTTKDPEKTRKALESWMPKDLWKDASLHLVGFGQTICKPIKPKCQNCLNCDICPSSNHRTQ